MKKKLIIAISVLLLISMIFGYVMSFSTTIGYLDSIFSTMQNAVASVSGTLGFNVFNAEIDNSEMLKKTYSNGLTGYENISNWFGACQRYVENGEVTDETYGNITDLQYIANFQFSTYYCSPYCWEVSLQDYDGGSWGSGSWTNTTKTAYAMCLNGDYHDTDGNAYNVDILLILPFDVRVGGSYITADNGYVVGKRTEWFTTEFIATNVLIMESTNKFTPLWDCDLDPSENHKNWIGADVENLTSKNGFGVWSANITSQLTFEQLMEKIIQGVNIQ